ncbi:hypothetical protein [Endozoicomonas lisbonensis]|uniref:Uncharacterized protein n=1 Tax=Endozoicomonas lisbonensis TaxID=3120522 RepID=A0ABV2SFH6_9GAMM
MIDPALNAALNRPTVRPLMLVEIVWKEGVTRVHSGLGDYQYNGQTFRGLGDLGKVSVIKQQNGESPSRLNLTLSSFDDSVRGEALSARYVGQPVKLWLAALDDDHQIEASQMLWHGAISDGGVVVGKNNKITLTVSNRLEDWDKARADRYTDESHQARHPGDRFFIYVPVMAEYPIHWGSDKNSIPLKDSI